MTDRTPSASVAVETGTQAARGLPTGRSRSSLTRLEPLRSVKTSALEVSYYEAGPPTGAPVLLLHGFPYDIHAYINVIPLLADAGLRVIVPYLRGFGPTRFLDPSGPRSGQQAALGRDVVELMDALDIPRATLAGYDWGGRAACVAAALWPERCAGLVSVNSYLIEDVRKAVNPIDPSLEATLWFFFYFATERGQRGLTASRRQITRLIWTGLSPTWQFDDPTFDRAATAFDNEDFVEVVIHSFRHRLGFAPGLPAYAGLEERLSTQPPILVPAITLDGQAAGNAPATDGTASAAHFSGPRIHRQVPDAGHNLPQETPEPFAEAILDLFRVYRDR